MTIDAEAASAPPAKPSGWARIAGALVSPGETMTDIARRPDFWTPLILIMVCSLIGGVVMATQIDFAAMVRETVLSTPRGHEIPKEALETQVKWGAAIARVMSFLGPLMTVVILAVIAAVLLAAFKLMGGDGDFKQAFAITTYGWLPMLIKSLIVIVVVIARKHTWTMYELQNPVMSNLAFLVKAKDHPVLANLLSQFDVFTFWMLALLVIGFAAMSRFSRAKAATIIGALWCAKLFFSVAMSALGTLGRRAS
jgi:hypothetical protein